MDRKFYARKALEDTLIPIRPGSDTAPFWNRCATRFIFAPAFKFKKLDGAVKYRFTVTDRLENVYTFEADTPYAPLSPVWKDVVPGPAAVTAEGFDQAENSLGESGRFQFYRNAPFNACYPPKVREYRECAEKAYRYLFDLPSIRHWKTGEPDWSYELNCYPSKMQASIICGMLRYADLRPEIREEALEIAEKCADRLIAKAIPSGEPLEYLPLTYEGECRSAKRLSGTIMMIYPAEVGSAMIKLAEAAKKSAYLDYARKIAEQYRRLQQPNGSWHLVLRIDSGAPLNENVFSEPTVILDFLKELAAATGSGEWDETIARSIPYLREMCRTFDWAGQFEDTELSTEPYSNLSKHMACDVIFFLLKNFPGDPEIIRAAREVKRFVEDQFIVWEQPGWIGTSALYTDDRLQNGKWGWYDTWHVPTALEQYRFYCPVDASMAKLIRYFLFMYDLDGDKLDLAKARVLGDSVTQFQEDSGFISTIFMGKPADWRDCTWINCMYASAQAMNLLAQYDNIQL